MLSYSTIQRHHEDLGLAIENRTDIEWICLHIDKCAQQRSLSEIHLKQIIMP